MNTFQGFEIRKFNHLVDEIDAVYHEAALKFGMADSAFLVLYSICNEGERCLLSDIYKLSGTSKQTINSAIRKLEQEGAVYLESYRGRKKMVCLTEKGKELVKDTVIRVIEMEKEIFGSWSESEQKAYMELTQRFLNDFKEKTADL